MYNLEFKKQEPENNKSIDDKIAELRTRPNAFLEVAQEYAQELQDNPKIIKAMIKTEQVKQEQNEERIRMYEYLKEKGCKTLGEAAEYLSQVPHNRVKGWVEKDIIQGPLYEALKSAYPGLYEELNKSREPPPEVKQSADAFFKNRSKLEFLVIRRQQWPVVEGQSEEIDGPKIEG